MPNSEVLYGEVMRAARLGMFLVRSSVAEDRALSCMPSRKKQHADASVH
jgi:hypothetical protein